MPNTYYPAPNVRRIAQAIIAEHHEHLLTNQVYIKFLFCDEAEKVKSKEVLGTARKIGDLNAYLALKDDPDVPRGFNRIDRDLPGKPQVDEFFLITIYQPWFKSRDTTDHQRRALVDHELTHCWSEEQLDKDGAPTGKILLSLLPHDLEEFDIIASRYGAWDPGIEAFTTALKEGQPSLFDGLDDPEPAKAFQTRRTHDA